MEKTKTRTGNYRKIKLLLLVMVGIPLFILSGYVLIIYQDLHRPGIVVLLYHQVIENEKEWSNKYRHRVSDFIQQLDYLSQQGYRTVIPSETHRFAEICNDEKIIILTFDDGTPDHYEIVYPLLMQRKMKGVFFVIAGNLDKRYGLSASQLMEMSQNGMEIGSHSFSHPFLDEMTEEEIFIELETSKQVLSDAIGAEVTSFAPPGGWYNDLVEQIAKNVGYTAFFSCDIGVNDITQPIYIYKRIEVLGNISRDEFIRLLSPPQVLGYKLRQSIKFFIHRLLGTSNYGKLAEIL